MGVRPIRPGEEPKLTLWQAAILVSFALAFAYGCVIFLYHMAK